MKRREDKSDPPAKREKRSSRSSSKSADANPVSSHSQSDSSSEGVSLGRKTTVATSKHVSKDKKDVELAEKIDKHEEEEADNNDPLEDLSRFKTTCGDFENAVCQIHQLKAKGESKSDADALQIAEQRSNIVMLATELRSLNRRAQLRVKKAKENTNEVKKKVDACHLDLQNLLYEIMHMKQEITKCTDFTSKDEDIELVSLEEFYADAPEEISKPDITQSDPHQQMLCRLDWELKQREQMAARKEECLSLKQDILQELQKKAGCLEAAAPGLDNILKVAGQLLDSIGYLEASKKEAMDYEMAQYLPQPLYGLYVQAKSYKDVWDKSLVVNIEGDVQEAKAADAPIKEITFGDDAEEDIDADEQVDEGERENEKHRKTEEEKRQFRMEAKRKNILKVHPLHIKLIMQCHDEAEVTLSFYYFTTLKIVTVKISLRLLKSEQAPIASSCPLLQQESVLCSLYDNDTGRTTPNQANHSQLQSLGMTSLSSLSKDVGVPYYWAQWLCWLKYLPTENFQHDLANSLTEAQRVENVLKAIKERVLDRMSLQRQLAFFEKLEVPRGAPNVSGPIEDPVTRLASWKSITEEEVKNMSVTTQFDSSKLLENSHSYYLASFERREGTLACIIVLHTDYPHRPPIFILKVKMKNSKVVEVNCVRAMEKEINTCCSQELIPSKANLVLTAQIKKLQLFFDIFCETQSEEPSRTRLFLNAKSGRDRRNPLKYVIEGQLKLFVHQE